MDKFQGMRIIYLTVGLSLIITFALLIHADFAGAGGLGKIGPNQGFETAILLKAQSYILSTTQSTAFGIHGVNILSAFNERLESTLEIDKGSLQPGTYLVLLWGVGGGIGGVGGSGGTDMHFGLTSASGPHDGPVEVVVIKTTTVVTDRRRLLADLFKKILD